MADKKLGFGLMRLPLTDPDNGGSINIPLLRQMVDTFLERGFTYFDTAWMYCDGKSECAVKEALTSRYPRDKFTVTSKLPPGRFLKNKESRDTVFEKQLERTGLDYFDYYLLHNVNAKTVKDFNELDCFSWLSDKKKGGKAKKIGISYHDTPELLDSILTAHPELDVVQLQINYLDWENRGIQSRACYETAVKHGKPVIVMEPVKGGFLANVPNEVEHMFRECDPEMSVPSWAIRFAASLDNVMLVLSGMSDMQQVLDNTGYMESFVPLTDAETEMVHKAADIISGGVAIPCTGCSYCTVHCPKDIAIPKYFSLYNADMLEFKGDPRTSQAAYYNNLSETFGKASDCIKCGQCEAMCPQHLPVIKHLEEVSRHFE